MNKKEGKINICNAFEGQCEICPYDCDMSFKPYDTKENWLIDLQGKLEALQTAIKIVECYEEK